MANRPERGAASSGSAGWIRFQQTYEARGEVPDSPQAPAKPDPHKPRKVVATHCSAALATNNRRSLARVARWIRRGAGTAMTAGFLASTSLS